MAFAMELRRNGGIAWCVWLNPIDEDDMRTKRFELTPDNWEARLFLGWNAYEEWLEAQPNRAEIEAADRLYEGMYRLLRSANAV